MELEDALAPGVDLDTFFVEHVPALFEARRELFASTYDTAIIVSVYLSDTDARYTAEFRPDGCTVEKGEMIDFPQATLVGSSDYWESVKRHILKIAEPLERRAKQTGQPSKVTREFLDELERFDGEFVFEIAAADLDTPVPFRLILNDYDAPKGAPSVKIQASFDIGEQLARGDIKPGDLDGLVRVRGDMSLGLEVGGLLLKHFPELED
jgi:hypothetical protein